MTEEMPEACGPRGPRVLQRIVFPGEDLDVVPLYVETKMERGAAELASELRSESLGHAQALPTTAPVTNAVAGETQSSIRFGVGLPVHPVEELLPWRSAVIGGGQRVSFATYFNAFPASYWRRWTTVDTVTLRIRLAGEATVVLYRSAAKGHSHPVETIRVGTDEPVTIERSLSLAPFIDGGWYWFDIVAGPQGTTLVEADWAAPPGQAHTGQAHTGQAHTGQAHTGRLSIGIPTFNRPDFMVEQLRTLGDAAGLLDLLDAVYVVDQGTNRLRDHPDFTDAAKKLGDRLQVIEQGNLGGSGGFSRVMDETLRAGRSDYVLVLDDDIKLEPEGILRAVTFADLARRPTIVGGHMFSLYHRAVLHALGETVARRTWWWGPAPNTATGHDFGRRNLRNTPWLHRRVDADYNGWWMCLIPTRIISEIGLGLPVFIKWDDAEYGLRASKGGYPTVSLPGVAAWHIAWQDKNDAQDWQAYYHLRNRVVVALLHSQFRRGGGLVAESAELQLQNLMSMRYSTAALRLLAIEDVLSGPAHLHRDIGTKMKDLRELRLRYTDGQAADDVESFPPVRGKPPAKDPVTQASRIGVLVKAAAGMAHQLTRPGKGARERPQMALPYQDAPWWLMSKLDSVLVSTPDGTTTAWHKRDRRLFASLGLRSVLLHLRLRRRWPRLVAEYRAAATEFTSPQMWRETFGASLDDLRDGP